MFTSEDTAAKLPQLRVCITEACDKKCFYCRATGEACPSIVSPSRLSTAALLRLISALAASGIKVVRLTGGEPMLNRDVYTIIAAIRAIPGIEHVSLVTRSLNLASEVGQLKHAGLSSITVSLDSLRFDRLKGITNVDMLDALLSGIHQCRTLGLPLTINTVVMKGVNDDEIEDFLRYVINLGETTMKFLDYMTLPGQYCDSDTDFFLNLSTIIPRIRQWATGERISTQTGTLGIPMPTFFLPNGASVCIKDSTAGNHYGNVCGGCPRYPCQDGIMALRLTSDGKLQRCLYRNDNLLDLAAGDAHGEQFKARIEAALRTYKTAFFRPRAWKPPVRAIIRDLTEADEPAAMEVARASFLEFVDARFHKMGIARSLLEAAESAIKKMNPSAERLWLRSSQFAVRIYEKLHFRVTGKPELSNGGFLTSMEKDILIPEGTSANVRHMEMLTPPKYDTQTTATKG